MERASTQFIHFEAIDTTTGNRRTGDAANITPYCVLDLGTVNALSTATIVEWSAAKSGTGIYAMQPSGAEANAKNALYFAISSTPNTRCVPVAVAVNPDGFSQCMSNGALINGVVILSNGDKTGYTLAAVGNNSVADALLDRADSIETGWTFRQALRILLAAMGGKASGLPGSPKYRNAIDTKDRITATTDANGNRSAVTLDGT